MWWVYDDGSNTIIETMGYSCAPNSPEHWWFPLLRTSVCEGHWCFPAKSEAIAAGVKKCEQALETAQNRLDQIKTMRDEHDGGPSSANAIAFFECNREDVK